MLLRAGRETRIPSSFVDEADMSVSDGILSEVILEKVKSSYTPVGRCFGSPPSFGEPCPSSSLSSSYPR
jgi:hypothetical protein